MEKFNEATRVQIPAMIHLTRLGYEYFGKISEEDAGTIYDPQTNILIQIFENQYNKLNKGAKITAQQMLQNIRNDLKNDDIGKVFYKKLLTLSPIKLIDFENIENNVFHFTAEFTYRNGNDAFRPDITLFINGLPLVFIELKKTNNRGGIRAEITRMNEERFPNKKFRSFINITQLMIFSNNMEYLSDGGIVPIQGAFYCTADKKSALFNCFREENKHNDDIAPFHRNFQYRPIDKKIEKRILKDFNWEVIYPTSEYQTNLFFNTPTNRILTSMVSLERLLFILRYGIAYVKFEKEVDGKIESIEQKHIIRYQQLFAALAIQKELSQGSKAGVVWHTQGSGKTALAFYLAQYLNDFYSKQNKVARFYFIVDRIDLLVQAKQEFEARGLTIATANSRKELMEQFRKVQSQEGSGGTPEVTVVNIQRFAEDQDAVTLPSTYATNLQRIFIVDEAHRGYKFGGTFLANLFEADSNSIKIALTGTPLLKEEQETSKVFNKYFHTYYYDASIADGYTLKIIREEIETSYKENLSAVKKKLDEMVEKKALTKSLVVEHEIYVKSLIKYIINDFHTFRIARGDPTLGAMVVCETSEQARNLKKYWDEVQEEENKNRKNPITLTAELILHDTGDGKTRKTIINNFKKNMTVDVLIVFNMLLTGFDAPRLKRLYLGRRLKDHNLLQALTRVNRPYKDNLYGFVIDFADIKQNFEETNAAYLRELRKFNVEEVGKEHENTLNNVLTDPQEIMSQVTEIRDALFEFTLDDLEKFSSEVSSISDPGKTHELLKVLETARDCFNIVRAFGDSSLKAIFTELDLTKLPQMLCEVKNHLNLLNQKKSFLSEDSSKFRINEAMMEIQFSFSKINEEELRIIDGGRELEEKYHKAIKTFLNNIDQEDPEYITLREAFQEVCKKSNFICDSIALYNEYNASMNHILEQLQKIQKKNQVLLKKYNDDAKFVRIHKRITEINHRRKENFEKPMFSNSESDVSTILNQIKKEVDQKVFDKSDILKKDAYFEQMVQSIVVGNFSQAPEMIKSASLEDFNFVVNAIARQYLGQFNQFTRAY